MKCVFTNIMHVKYLVYMPITRSQPEKTETGTKNKTITFPRKCISMTSTDKAMLLTHYVLDIEQVKHWPCQKQSALTQNQLQLWFC
jgi:hypothetical protein